MKAKNETSGIIRSSFRRLKNNVWLVKLKNKELKNIRKLAQIILDQRTEVEQFFLEALEQVKSEVRRAREERDARERARAERERLADELFAVAPAVLLQQSQQLLPPQSGGERRRRRRRRRR